MIQDIVRKILVLCVALAPAFAIGQEKQEEEFNVTEMALEHISDSHDYHIMDWKGHAISIPLPVILYTDKGIVTFCSSDFKHDDKGVVVVEKKGQKFVKDKGQIYYYEEQTGGHTEKRPLDFSITKNVVTLFLVVLLLFVIFVGMAKKYKDKNSAPGGIAAFLEPIVIFIRDEIAIVNIGQHKYEKYMPYLLTVFFMILFGNILGLIPIISGTLTNDIVFTGTLAFITFLIITFSGNKNYWRHIFAVPGVPVWLLPIMIPVEILSMFTKPFALMIRLFANITAGHLVILSFLSLIFVMKSVWMSVPSLAFALFVNFVEILVAFLQAYVFTLLSALFIGTAVEEAHHD